jgi:hypothetical protein
MGAYVPSGFKAKLPEWSLQVTRGIASLGSSMIVGKAVI